MMRFKSICSFVLAGVAAFSMLTGCSQQETSSGSSSQQTQLQSQSQSSSSQATSSGSETSSLSEAPPSSESAAVPEEPEGGRTLVLYFSASGNTKAVAETIAGTVDAELYELIPTDPYTDADLNWTVADSRVNTEHNDPNYRTAIGGELPDFSLYDTIFLGYPLWWREAPSIVWNLVENTSLAGKTIIPFCTSTSDGIKGSVETLRGMAPDADWQSGQRFGENLNKDAVADWVNSLGLEAVGTTAASVNNSAPEATALVVYFSVPEDVDTTGVDAIAGASILVSNGTALGNMQFMAQLIQRETGADLYRIVEQTPYPLDHQPLIEQAQQEQRNNERPAIVGELPDLSGYDVIYLGYPNWWGDMPMILYTFLDSVDLSGKTVIPFCVHGGNGFSNTIDSIREEEPEAIVLDGLTISRNQIGQSEQQIVDWVKGLAVNQ